MSAIDVFFHDSDHSYKGQMSEYLAVERKLVDAGFILSDDVDYSYAFLDYCRRKRSEPSFLVDRRKVMGLVQLPGSGEAAIAHGGPTGAAQRLRGDQASS